MSLVFLWLKTARWTDTAIFRCCPIFIFKQHGCLCEASLALKYVPSPSAWTDASNYRTCAWSFSLGSRSLSLCKPSGCVQV